MGMKAAPIRRIMDGKLIWVPHIDLKVRGARGEREYWIDAYFLTLLENIVRRAALIRRPEAGVKEVETPLDSIRLDPKVGGCEDVLRMFKEAYLYADSIARSKGYERSVHIARWTQLKNFMIPTGHQKHIDRDERDAMILSEALWAREIIGLAFMVNNPYEWGRLRIHGGEIYWYPVFIKTEGETLLIFDGVSGQISRTYTNLANVEETVKAEFSRLARL